MNDSNSPKYHKTTFMLFNYLYLYVYISTFIHKIYVHNDHYILPITHYSICWWINLKLYKNNQIKIQTNLEFRFPKKLISIGFS